MGAPRQPDGRIQALRYLTDALDAVAPALHRREERRRVLLVSRFEREPDLGLVDGDRRALSAVLDVDHVDALGGHEIEQLLQLARPIRHARSDER